MLIASMGEELETRVERLVRYKIYCLNITASSVFKNGTYFVSLVFKSHSSLMAKSSARWQEG